MQIGNVSFVYPNNEENDVYIIKSAIEKCNMVCKDHWGFETPQDIKLILMTSWEMFLEEAVPDKQRWKLWFIRKFNAARFEQIWEIAGGWNQSFGNCVVAGVKPGYLIKAADRSIGKEIFIDEEIHEKVFTVTCHELTHAHSDFLKLPVWLHEGLAMRTADLCAGKQTVRPDSLDLLRYSNKGRITRYDLKDEAVLVLLYLRSYWLVRWLESEHLESLKKHFDKPHSPKEFEIWIAKLMGFPVNLLWSQMDLFLADYFLE